MTDNPLRIAVLKDRYPMQFMTARHSRHILDWRRFVPFNQIHPGLEGMTVMAPGRPADLVHTNNRIPLGARKYILSFEDNAPRRFRFPEDNRLTRFLDDRIASPRCRRLIAMSDFARRRFLHQHRDNPDLPRLRAKLDVRYPNIVIRDTQDQLRDDPCTTLVLTFVGAHFARKGGCVAVRIAQKALAAGLPIRVNIVSPLVMGKAVWTDPERPEFFKEYTDLLTLENVEYNSTMPNAQTRQKLAQSHFCVLTTFVDTFGFSAIEAMAEHTPVLGTRLCALPEFIEDDRNGILIDMPVNALGMWQRPQDISRASPEYEDYFRAEVDRIASAAVDRLTPLIGDRDRIARMRRAARDTAVEKFDSRAASIRWDALYDEVAAEDPATPPRLTEADRSAAGDLP
ncbi:glycosyltransferase family 4 protein [Paracoccus stylophorae]|uniref:Glycosyltransferase family 4 protein n=1 Tax=Paracoccus stylophorae TaxID=659350 RepID=A0ABY7SWW1_9RHOB|nr:glycosyltransferase family 4 protein [Paracoccus stylophorae]WCR10716.1 glycosyltransferase family 4 protein [Paracoccus stylophorae]